MIVSKGSVVANLVDSLKLKLKEYRKRANKRLGELIAKQESQLKTKNVKIGELRLRQTDKQTIVKNMRQNVGLQRKTADSAISRRGSRETHKESAYRQNELLRGRGGAGANTNGQMSSFWEKMNDIDQKLGSIDNSIADIAQVRGGRRNPW